MDENDYWKSLEFRVCREFAGMPVKELRQLWCDGFLPRQYHVTGPRPRIVGTAWIGASSQLEEWEFTLRLPKRVASRAKIDWASLMPSDDVTRWMSLDRDRRLLLIEPAVAVPDFD